MISDNDAVFCDQCGYQLVQELQQRVEAVHWGNWIAKKLETLRSGMIQKKLIDILRPDLSTRFLKRLSLMPFGLKVMLFILFYALIVSMVRLFTLTGIERIFFPWYFDVVEFTLLLIFLIGIVWRIDFIRRFWVITLGVVLMLMLFLIVKGASRPNSRYEMFPVGIKLVMLTYLMSPQAKKYFQWWCPDDV
jgi:hypothetical protein